MWLAKGEYKRLLRELARAEKRALTAESALAAERTENRIAERWWADCVLRAKQALPLSARQTGTEPPDEQLPVPVYDDGELEAVIAQGAAYGVSAAEARRLFLQSKGIE